MKKRILILLGILIIGGGAAAGVCWKMGVFGQQETSGQCRRSQRESAERAAFV